VGYDAGKHLKGRKIHSLVDTLGLPIRLVIHSAGIQDRDGAALLFEKIKPRFPWLDCVFADTGYNAQQTYEAAGANALRLEIVRRNPNAVGFEIIKRRWVVERTFSCSAETDAWPRISRTSPRPCWPSSPSPPSSSELGGSHDDRLLSQALTGKQINPTWIDEESKERQVVDLFKDPMPRQSLAGSKLEGRGGLTRTALQHGALLEELGL
jgi:transposase